MKTLLVCDAYPPEVSSSANLIAELAEELSHRGHHVTVLTSWPGYKLDATHGARAFNECMVENDIKVLRIKTMPLHNVPWVVRGISTLMLPFQFWAGLRRHTNGKFDAVLVYSPPITQAFIGSWVKRRGARFVLNVQDIFPRYAVDLGVLTSSWQIRLFRTIEKHAYKRADIITAHSKANCACLIADNSEVRKKIVMLHNWVDIEQFDASAKNEDFRQTYGLKDKFVIVYGGVFGPAQDLSVALDVAAKLKDLDRVVFLLVGDGVERKKLEKRVVAEDLSNVVFQDFVSRDRFPALLRSCDLGLLTLSAKIKTPVVPGKLLAYMAAALPPLAIVNPESDARSIIADAQCGFSCDPNAADEAASIIRKAYAQRNLLPQMGKKGYAYVRSNFSKSVIVDEIEKLFSTAHWGVKAGTVSQIASGDRDVANVL